MTPYELAKSEVGTMEWAEGSNPKVVAYYRDAGFPEVKDDAVAWCAAFVGAMIKRAGGKPSGSLAARSYLKWGKPVALLDAKPGDIVVFRRGNSTWQGHVGFFVSHKAGLIQVLGGNQRDAVNIAGQPVAKLLGVVRGNFVDQKQPYSAPQAKSDPKVEPQTHFSPGSSPILLPSSFWARIIAALFKGLSK